MSAQEQPIRVCVMTVSDRCSRGETADTSGPALCAVANQKLEADVVGTECVPDEQDAIAHELRNLIKSFSPDLILTTGGTGLAPRDVTPEATRQVMEREHEGLMRLIQHRCYEKTAFAFLSRGIAGAVGKTLIINLPGSKKGALESLEAILDVLPHAVKSLRGSVEEHGPAAH